MVFDLSNRYQLMSIAYDVTTGEKMFDQASDKSPVVLLTLPKHNDRILMRDE